MRVSPQWSVRVKKQMRILSVITVAMLLASCTGGGGGYGGSMSPGSGSAMMSFNLMDGPFRTSGGTVRAVNVTIKSVQLIGTGGPQTIVSFSPSESVNLLNYETTPLSLGSAALPAGHYQQVRLVLDTSQSSNTTVVINGTTYPLTIPSATGPYGFGNNDALDNTTGPGTSGIKVNINLTAQGGYTYAFVLDFNAAESIIDSGGRWQMKPVLVAAPQATSGAIAGMVKDNAGSAVSGAEVLAQQNGTTINSGVTDTNGNFQINALPAGTYTLVVNNVWTNQAGQSETASRADGTSTVTDPNPATVTAGSTTTVTITD